MSDNVTMPRSTSPIELITPRTDSDLETNVALTVSTIVDVTDTPDAEIPPDDVAESGHEPKEAETTLHQQESLLLEGIQRIKAENDLLQQQNATLKTDLSDTTKALRAEEREHASTSKRVQDLEDRVKVFEQSAQALQNQIAELKAEKKGLAAEKRSAASNLNSSKAKLEKDRRELASIKEKLLDGQTELGIQRSKVEEGQIDIQQLRKENEKLVQKVADVEWNNKIKEHGWDRTILEKHNLEKRLRVCKPLVDVGAAVRRRYFERAKQDFTTGAYVDVRGIANLEAIEAGHRAAHRANVDADFALFSLEYLDPDQDAATFGEVYHIEMPIESFDLGFLTPWAKRTEIMNMDATLRCLLRSNYTIEPISYLEQFRHLCDLHITAMNMASGSKETRDKMDQDRR